GAQLGGEGTIAIDGTFTFDRKGRRIVRLAVDRAETRKAGQVDPALDVKSTLTMERQPAEAPPELIDAAPAGVPLQLKPGLDLLQYAPPDGKYTLVHDRDWYLIMAANKQSVLRRLDHGELLAQCNLAVAPNAGRGRHQDIEQFRDDVRKALGRGFVRVA